MHAFVWCGVLSLCLGSYVLFVGRFMSVCVDLYVSMQE